MIKRIVLFLRVAALFIAATIVGAGATGAAKPRSARQERAFRSHLEGRSGAAELVDLRRVHLMSQRHSAG